jgi:hypothetical protein
MARITVSTSEPFSNVSARLRAGMEFAVSTGVRAAGEGLKIELRQHVSGALTPRIANAIGSWSYPSSGNHLGQVVVVGARSKRADDLLEAHEEGVTIGPKNGQALAIPTENVPIAPGRGGGRRMTPVEVEAAYNKELRLVQGGHLHMRKAIGLLVLDVDLNSIHTRNIGRRGFRGGKRALKRGGLRQSVVMFILVRIVRLPKRLNAEAIARQWLERTPDLIDRAIPEDAI